MKTWTSIAAAAMLAAPALCATTQSLSVKKTIASDDFEDAAAVREGKPELIEGIVSPGLLTQTHMGRYRTSGVKQLWCRHPGLVTGVNLYLMTSLRIYSLSDGAQLESAFLTGKLPGDTVFSVKATRHGGEISVEASEDGRVAGTLTLACDRLPADLSVALSPAGEFVVAAKSLVDSGMVETAGKAGFLSAYPRYVRAFWWLRAPAGGAEAEATVDAYRLCIAERNDSEAVPFAIERLPEFDPAKAGWKLVFEDEFDGAEVDWKDKWFQPYYDVHPHEMAATDGEGHLKIKIDFEPGSTNRLHSTSLYTRRAFGYGYYEARLKFTNQNGFWTAFWTYGDSNTNPFLDGFEIDGYEDYYLRYKDPKDRCLDHNLHIRGGLGRGKSWNYRATLPGPIDRWYTLGVKWTPFEISYYLDGKLLDSRSVVGHSPWDTVTFDAFNHAACTAPNHAVLSGCIMRSSWSKAWQDISGCKFPAYFTVDRVRVWEYPDPQDEKPSVAWTADSLAAGAFVPTGTTFRVAADVRPAAKTGAKVKGVYLFANGFMLQYRKEPPYVFDVTLSDEFLGKTAYARPGRQGLVFSLAGSGQPFELHVFAQDENGRVGRTDRTLPRIPLVGRSTPYGGEAQRLPGTLNPARFDEGGLNVAYFKHPLAVQGKRDDLNPRPSRAFRGDEAVSCSEDGTALDFTVSGDWLNYTVDIAAAGVYEVAFPYGANGTGINEVRFLVDGRMAGTAKLGRHESVKFERDLSASARVELPAGRHIVTLLPIGPMSLGPMRFTLH